MEPAKVRHLLRLHRPGRDAETDPLVAAALVAARQDPGLSRWLAAEEDLDTALAARWEEALPVPAGLRESLLAAPWRTRIEEADGAAATPESEAAPPTSRPRPRAAGPGSSSAWWWPALAGGAVASALTFLATSSGLRFPGSAPAPAPRPATVATPAALSEFRSEMVAFVRLPPPLELTTPDAKQMQAYLRGRETPLDVAVPDGLGKLRGAGCRTLSFRHRPVALLCFLPPGEGLTHLLVVDRTVLPTTGTRGAPVVAAEGEWLTAAWTQGGFTYLLCARAGEPQLREYLAGS